MIFSVVSRQRWVAKWMFNSYVLGYMSFSIPKTQLYEFLHTKHKIKTME
jgi:hypothetical protein